GWAANRRRYEDRWIYDSIPDTAAARLWPWPSDAATTSDGLAPRGGARPPQPAAAVGGPRLPASMLAAAERARDLFPRRDPEHADRASDEFVVGAKRSASGKPILANDPHLGLATPGPSYVVQVSVPGVVDAVGGGAAGLPAIVVGRNTHAAWGVTALSADVVDVYADTLSADGRRVRTHALDGSADWAPVRTEP